MKTLVPVLAILAAGTVFAQRNGGGMRPSGYGSNSGFGSILYPGGHPPNPYAGWSSPSHGGAGYRSRRVVAAYPIFYGGYGYGYGYEQPAQAEPPPQTVVVQQPAAQAPAPQIVINQYFRSDGPAMTTGDPQTAYHAPAARQDDKPTIYLIAMKDHTIMPALGYWIEGDTLSYITSQGSKNSISLTLVDRDFSRQLNNERHVEFTL